MGAQRILGVVGGAGLDTPEVPGGQALREDLGECPSPGGRVGSCWN